MPLQRLGSAHDACGPVVVLPLLVLMHLASAAFAASTGAGTNSSAAPLFAGVVDTEANSIATVLQRVALQIPIDIDLVFVLAVDAVYDGFNASTSVCGLYPAVNDTNTGNATNYVNVSFAFIGDATRALNASMALEALPFATACGLGLLELVSFPDPDASNATTELRFNATLQSGVNASAFFASLAWLLGNVPASIFDVLAIANGGPNATSIVTFRVLGAHVSFIALRMMTLMDAELAAAGAVSLTQWEVPSPSPPVPSTAAPLRRDNGEDDGLSATTVAIIATAGGIVLFVLVIVGLRRLVRQGEDQNRAKLAARLDASRIPMQELDAVESGCGPPMPPPSPTLRLPRLTPAPRSSGNRANAAVELL